MGYSASPLSPHSQAMFAYPLSFLKGRGDRITKEQTYFYEHEFHELHELTFDQQRVLNQELENWRIYFSNTD